MTTRFTINLPGTTADKPQLKAIDSNLPNPKISTKADPRHAGIISLNWRSGLSLDGGTTKIIYSFPHNYNHIPSVLGNFIFDNGSTKISGTFPLQVGALGMILMDADPANVNFKYFSTDIAAPATAIPPFIMTVRFYVMAERGHE